MDLTLKSEICRKIVHLTGIFCVILTYFVNFQIVFAVLLLALFSSLTHHALRPITTKIPIIKQISDFLNSLARTGEKKKKVYYGAAYFFAALAIAFLVFPIDIFRIAAIVLIVGDSFSTIFGKLYGRTKLPYNKKKSVEGSVAGLAAAYLVLLLIHVPTPLALFAALIGMYTESLPWKFNDNLTIPLVVGFAIVLLTITPI